MLGRHQANPSPDSRVREKAEKTDEKDEKKEAEILFEIN